MEIGENKVIAKAYLVEDIGVLLMFKSPIDRDDFVNEVREQSPQKDASIPNNTHPSEPTANKGEVVGEAKAGA